MMMMMMVVMMMMMIMMIMVTLPLVPGTQIILTSIYIYCSCIKIKTFFCFSRTVLTGLGFLGGDWEKNKEKCQKVIVVKGLNQVQTLSQ